MRALALLALLALPCLALACATAEPRPDGAATSEADSANRGEGLPNAPRPLGFGALEEQSLYFVLVDRFHDGDGRSFEGLDPSSPLAFHGGDLKGLVEKLPYLADLGVTALWLTPLHRQVDEPFGPEGERRWPYHGEWPKTHVELDPRFGSYDDLRALVERAHALGLRVVLDVVTNHLGYGAPLAAHPTLVRSKELGTCPDNGNERARCLSGLPDLKTEEPSVRESVVAWTLSWVERFSVDGYGFGAARYVDPAVLWETHDRAERIVRAQGAADFLTLAAHEGATPDDDVVRAYTESGAADTLVDVSFASLVEDFLTGRMSAEALAHALEKWHRADGPPLVHALSARDAAPLVHRLGDARARFPLAPFLQMSVRGIPLVTWGDELARDSEGPPHHTDMPWARLEDDDGRRLHATWRALLHLRRRTPSLQGRDYATLLALSDEDGSATLAFRRGADRLVVVHRGPERTRLFEGLSPASAIERCVAFGSFEARTPSVDDKGRLTLALPTDSAAVYALGDEGCSG